METDSFTDLPLFVEPPHAKGSGTSRAAAKEKTALSASAQRVLVARVLAATPCTREELCYATMLSGDSLRPRIWEMLRAAPPLVRAHGERRTESNRLAEVLELTDAGRAWLETV